MVVFFRILIIVTILTPIITYGEYRVYQYLVKSTYNLPHKNKSHLISSTLNPVSYLAYHGGPQFVSISLVKTWMCMGYTAKENICPDPLTQVPEALITKAE